MINSIPSNFANTVAPFAPMGRAPVGQESTDLKSSTFRPTEQLAESGRGQNRRLPDERPNDEVERDRVERGAQSSSSDQAAQDAAVKRRAQQENQQAERDQIQELSARDREVRSHEQAHAAIAGQYGSSPTYSFVRGPDGVSYAVGGEVKIDTSPIPGDPAASLRKAQQLRRAANAPADPSSQDGSVAAQAAQMEQQARAELREQQAIKSGQGSTNEDSGQQDSQITTDKSGQNDPFSQEGQAERQRLADEEAKLQADQERFEAERRQLDQRQARAEMFNESTKRNIDINRRLMEIGVFNTGSGIGGFLNKTV